MNRLGLKIFCLLAALVIWIQVAAGHYVERSVGLPLELVGLQPGLTLAGNTWPETVPVRARGSKWQFFLDRWFGQRLGTVRVDLGQIQAGDDLLRELTTNDVAAQLTDITITPPIWLRLRVDRVDTLMVPVAVVTTGELPHERMLLSSLRAVPDSVPLVGPSRFFAGDETVPTEAVDLSKHRSRTVLTRRLVPPHAHLAPTVAEVQILLPIATVGTRVFEHVPIVPLVDAGQPRVEVFPPVSNLVVRGPADSLAALTSADISVAVPLSGLPPGVHHLGAQVILPEHYDLVSLEPREFMVVIGNSAGGGGRDRRP